MINTDKWTEALMEAGFNAGGVANPIIHAKDATALSSWLKKGFQGEMTWMEQSAPTRLEPSTFSKPSISILCCGMDTYGQMGKSLPGGGKIAGYACTRDYHKPVKKKLKALAALLMKFSGFNIHEARLAVDLHPVLERALASQAGMGWFGKQSQLIHPVFGPWLLLGELFLPVELERSNSMTSKGCGQCTACMKACPTGAIVSPGVVDSRRCISFWTVEAKGLPPMELRDRWDGHFFGCDACLEACPIRKKNPFTTGYNSNHELIENYSLKDFILMTEGDYDLATRGSSLRRAGRTGLARNAALAAGSLGLTELIDPMTTLLERAEPELRAIGAWGYLRIGGKKQLIYEYKKKEPVSWVCKEMEILLAASN